MPPPRNPFPGMDPFFQDGWGNAYVFLLSGIDSTIQETLPCELVARIEGRTAEVVDANVEPDEEHWLEIREVSGRVVTVVEVLCPANKSEEGWRSSRQRQQDSLAAGVLQPLIDECYRVGRYWLTDGARDLAPPLSAEDTAWVQERLKAAGLVE